MAFDAEREVTRLWKGLQGAQAEAGANWFRWREAALSLVPDADPLEVSLKAAEVTGSELGAKFIPRLNWLKGEEKWSQNLARAIAAHWIGQGALVEVEPGDGEILIRWTRCPWPTWARKYGAPMEEDVRCCDHILQTLLLDINVFFNTDYRIETLKAIPRGQGECLRRLYKGGE